MVVLYHCRLDKIAKHIHKINNKILNPIPFDILHRKMIHHCKMYANISGTSQTFNNLSKKRNMTAQVFDESDPKSCTKNVFRGSPQQLGLFMLIIYASIPFHYVT